MVDRELCTGCGVCGAVCSVKAISMERDREGFLRPRIDKDLCTGCGRCDGVCPAEQGEQKTAGEHGHSCFGARAEDEAVRGRSSSGGIFPLLASRVLEQGGAVFGAALLEDASVRHICIRSKEELPRLIRTKYVQSDLSQVWGQLLPLLKRGPVLFCGTPCQADAVRAYLGEDRKGLILVDLICYGVPSPGLWEKYVAYLEKKHGGRLEAFSFRDKRRRHARAYSFQIDGQEHVGPLWDDPFCRLYFRNISIRPSCFRCRYTTVERTSDLTLGDFWGIERVNPDFDDGAGTSVVICHTPEGERLWEQVQEKTRYFPCRTEDAANPDQPRLKTPAQPSPGREMYMGLYGRIPFSLWLRLLGR